MYMYIHKVTFRQIELYKAIRYIKKQKTGSQQKKEQLSDNKKEKQKSLSSCFPSAIWKKTKYKKNNNKKLLANTQKSQTWNGH